jgi:hypothetical protein
MFPARSAMTSLHIHMQQPGRRILYEKTFSLETFGIEVY